MTGPLKHAAPHTPQLILATILVIGGIGCAIGDYFVAKQYQDETDKSSSEAKSKWNLFIVLGIAFIALLSLGSLAASWSLIKEHHNGFVLVPLVVLLLSGGGFYYLYHQNKK